MLARFPAAISVMVALAAAWALAMPAAHADAVADFYKGRQLNLIVGYGPGGGYDLTARLLARRQGLLDLLLGVLGDFVPPRALVSGILAR